MFDELFSIPAFVKKYRTAPLAEPRARYLRHLKGLGACRATLTPFPPSSAALRAWRMQPRTASGLWSPVKAAIGAALRPRHRMTYHQAALPSRSTRSTAEHGHPPLIYSTSCSCKATDRSKTIPTPDLLWSLANVLHRKVDRIARTLDDNEIAQRRSQASRTVRRYAPSDSKG